MKEFAIHKHLTFTSLTFFTESPVFSILRNVFDQTGVSAWSLQWESKLKGKFMHLDDGSKLYPALVTYSYDVALLRTQQ